MMLKKTFLPLIYLIVILAGICNIVFKAPLRAQKSAYIKKIRR